MRALQQIAVIFVGLGAGVGLGLWFLNAPGSASKPSKPDPQAAAGRALLFFTEENCIWCERMKQVMKDPAVQSALKRYEVREIRNPALAQKYGVMGYPSFVITNQRGRVVSRQIGYQDADGFAAWLTSGAR